MSMWRWVRIMDCTSCLWVQCVGVCVMGLSELELEAVWAAQHRCYKLNRGPMVKQEAYLTAEPPLWCQASFLIPKFSKEIGGLQMQTLLKLMCHRISSLHPLILLCAMFALGRLTDWQDYEVNGRAEYGARSPKSLAPSFCELVSFDANSE